MYGQKSDTILVDNIRHHYFSVAFIKWRLRDSHKMPRLGVVIPFRCLFHWAASRPAVVSNDGGSVKTEEVFFFETFPLTRDIDLQSLHTSPLFPNPPQLQPLVTLSLTNSALRVFNNFIMESIYLDYNCFQRGFDDSRQIKIRLEAFACQEVFARAENKEVSLVWSFMHEDENALCPFIERKIEVLRLSALCEERIGPGPEIRTVAKNFQEKAALSSKDSVHLACADHAGCAVFVTCDDELIKRAKRLNLPMRIMNPVDYIREVEKHESARA